MREENERRTEKHYKIAGIVFNKAQKPRPAIRACGGFPLWSKAEDNEKGYDLKAYEDDTPDGHRADADGLDNGAKPYAHENVGEGAHTASDPVIYVRPGVEKIDVEL